MHYAIRGLDVSLHHPGLTSVTSDNHSATPDIYGQVSAFDSRRVHAISEISAVYFSRQNVVRQNIHQPIMICEQSIHCGLTESSESVIVRSKNGEGSRTLKHWHEAPCNDSLD